MTPDKMKELILDIVLEALEVEKHLLVEASKLNTTKITVDLTSLIKSGRSPIEIQNVINSIDLMKKMGPEINNLIQTIKSSTSSKQP